MRHLLPILALTALITPLAPAAVVTFTGGTVTRSDSTTGTTDGLITFYGVDFYTEGLFSTPQQEDRGAKNEKTRGSRLGNYLEGGIRQGDGSRIEVADATEPHEVRSDAQGKLGNFHGGEIK